MLLQVDGGAARGASWVFFHHTSHHGIVMRKASREQVIQEVKGLALREFQLNLTMGASIAMAPVFVGRPEPVPVDASQQH
jgi:hypothetical protein